MALSRLGFPLAAAALLLVVSGCVSAPSKPAAHADDHDGMEGMDHMHMSTPSGSFSMDAAQCEEAGFVSAYQGTMKYAGAWDSADIRDEMGRPTRDGLGSPSPLLMEQYGNWHMGYRCASATHAGQEAKQFMFGWVGDMVKPPAFDPGGADVEFIITGLAFQNGTFQDDLKATTGAEITPAYNTHADWLVPKDLPRSAVYEAFCDSVRGVYESWSNMNYYRDTPARVVRLWWEVPADGSVSTSGHVHSTGNMQGKYHPMYWDIIEQGSKEYTTPSADQAEIGSHNKLEFEHGPVVFQPMSTVIYEHKGLTFTSGHVIEDVTLDTVWTH